jgi:hypothetical protein
MIMPNRVLVCGGRNYANWDLVVKTLAEIRRTKGITLLMHGGAPGADKLAGNWGQLANVPMEVFKADWAKHGRAAGPIRNQQMLDDGKPDMVVAFPGGRGTADMIRRAKAAGVKVTSIDGGSEHD